MFVARYIRKKSGKEYGSSYIVESYRDENGKPKHRRLLNISHLSEEKILAVKAALQGKNLVDWDELPGLESQDFGVPYFTLKTLENIAFPEILGQDSEKHWHTIVSMIASRIDDPCAKYSIKYWARTTALKRLLRESDECFYHHKSC